MTDVWFLSGTGSATTPDLSTWTAVAATPGDGQLVYGQSKWVLGRPDGIWMSRDGLTWAHVLDLPCEVFDVVFTGSRFLAIGSFGNTTGGAPAVAVSPDGVTWTTVSTGFEVTGYALAYLAGAGSSWVASFQDDRVSGHPTNLLIRTADSGDTWAAASPVDPTIETTIGPLAYGPAGWVSASPAMHSADGDTWTNINLTSHSVNATSTVGVIGSTYYLSAHTSGGAYITLTSTDGITWTSHTAATGFAPFPLRYLNGYLIGFASGHVWAAADGITWVDVYADPGPGPGPLSIGFGAYGAVRHRLRQFPRDDALGGQPRQGKAARSTQSTARQGWTNTYR